jgi:hypothetical protein
MRFNEIVTEMANLAGKELFKYRNTRKDRVPVFLEKIKEKNPFTIKTTNGKEQVVIDPTELSKAEQWVKNPVGNLLLKAMDGRKIPLGSIIKTKEFGGEEPGQREKIEQGQIGDIEKQLESFKNGQPSIKLKVGNRIVDAARVGKTVETVYGRAPKSDMTVYDTNNNAVAWVSLKGLHFRWGGWLHLAKIPEINDWIKKVFKTVGGTLYNGDAYGHHLSPELANLIVFGKEFSKAPGISNVDLVIIGDADIKKIGDHIELTGTRTYANGETPTGKDEPYLVLRYYRTRNDFGIENARGETNTKSEGRKVRWLN